MWRVGPTEKLSQRLVEEGGGFAMRKLRRFHDSFVLLSTNCKLKQTGQEVHCDLAKSEHCPKKTYAYVFTLTCFEVEKP